MRKSRRFVVKSFKAKRDKQRNWLGKLADFISDIFGTTQFLLINAAFFAVWIVLNINGLVLEKPFDPYPYGLLTMIVSLEAIFLSIIVLISQNRVSKIDDLREEVDLQVNVIAEREITKIMNMLNLLLEKHGIDLSDDQELKSMLQPVESEKLEETLEKEIQSQRYS